MWWQIRTLREGLKIPRPTENLATREHGISPTEQVEKKEPRAKRSPQETAKSGAELLASLRDLDGRQLSPDAHEAEEERLMMRLIEVDPQLALESFFSQIQEENSVAATQLPEALAIWARRDSAAAIAWLDEKIAAGALESKTLDGRSPAHQQLESAAISALLAGNPTAAQQRLAAMPADERATVLSQIDTTQLTPAARQEMVNCIRKHLPEASRESAFMQLTASLTEEGGYPAVERFLTEAKSTPAERAASVQQAAGTSLALMAEGRAVTVQDVAELRKWLEKQSPATACHTIGTALGRAVSADGAFSYDQAAALAISAQQTDASDDTLTAFLESTAASGEPEKSLALAEKLRDSTYREKLQKSFRDLIPKP
jgi:hypothetical protein